MEVTSALPSTVAAELSGAGSFFGSCQLEGGNFTAALNTAVAQSQSSDKGPANTPDAGKSQTVERQSGDMDKAVQAQTQDSESVQEQGTKTSQDGDASQKTEGKVSAALKETLGEEKATAYAEVAAALDEVAQDMDLEDLGSEELLALVQQLMGLLYPAQSPQPVETLEAAGVDVQMLSALATALQGLENEDAELLGQLQNLASDLLEASSLPQAPLEAVELDGATEVLLSSVQPKFVEEDVRAEESSPEEPFLEKADGEDEAVVKDLLASLPQKTEDAPDGQQESGEHREERSEQATEVKPSQQTQTETVVRLDGGELKIEVVDSKTGARVSVASSPDMQQRVQDYQVVRQVAEKVRYLVQQGQQTMSLQLNPKDLGRVDLTVTLKGSEMQVHAKVDSEVAQRALESNISLLREGLEKQNISLDRLEVSVEKQKDQLAAEDQASRQGQQGKQRGQRASGGRALGVTVSGLNTETGRRLGYNTMEYLA